MYMIKCIVNELALVNIHIDDNDLQLQVFRGLGKEYKDVRIVVRNRGFLTLLQKLKIMTFYSMSLL